MVGLEAAACLRIASAAHKRTELLGYAQVVTGVPVSGRSKLAALLEPVQRVRPDGLQHRDARLSLGRFRDSEEAGVDQVGHDLERFLDVASARPLRDDCGDGFEVGPA